MNHFAPAYGLGVLVLLAAVTTVRPAGDSTHDR